MQKAVDIIHRQLELLKYVGGTCTDAEGKPVPSGQGLLVSVVVLPDLLLDFRSYNLSPDKEGRVCAVGGRATRMACVLQHLAGDHDGTFQVSLLTKTGNLGGLLLQNEFFRELPLQPLRVPFLQYILSSGTEPRCALRTEPGGPARSRKARDKDELGAVDLTVPPLSRAIHQARAVCLASVRTPDFQGLLKHLVQTVQQPYQGLFVDCRRIGTERTTILKRELSEASKLVKVAGLFLKAEEKTEFLSDLKCETLQSVWRKHHLPLIYYGEGAKVTWIGGRGNEINTQCRADFQIEGVSECFKAGILLAWSVHSAVQALGSGLPAICDPTLLPWSVYSPIKEVSETNLKLQEGLCHEWPQDLDMHWQMILEYGAALAEARADPDIQIRFPELLRSLGYKTEHLPTGVDFEPRSLTNTSPASGHNRRLILENPTMVGCVARLAGWRRISDPTDLLNSSHNVLACHDHGLARCDSSSPRCSACVHTNGTCKVAAVMIDLDGTLMHSTEQRNRGLAKALTVLTKELADAAHRPNANKAVRDLAEAVNKVALGEHKNNKQEDKEKTENSVEFFTERIYKLHDLYKEKGIDLGDFRQKWNHSGWYVAYLVLAHDRQLREGAKRWATGVAESKDEPLEKTEWKNRFLAAYDRFASNYGGIIRKAQDAFESVQMHPFKEARDFLTSLKLTDSLGLYIVSEGDPETQWTKLRSMGLDDFFEREHVLTTGDAVEPVDFRKALQAEQRALDLEHTYIKEKRERIEAWLDQLGKVETKLLVKLPSSQTEAGAGVFSDTRLNGIRDLQDLDRHLDENLKRRKVAEFVGFAIDRMGGKNFLSFYAGAIRAILRNPSAPRSRLVRFGELLDPVSSDRKLKFVMIGDRQLNDIEPPSRLLKEKVLTVRMNSLEYATREPVRKSRNHPPVYVVDTLAQAKAILMTKETWNELPCASDPPIFNWEVNTTQRLFYPDPKRDSSIGINHILCGCMTPYKSFPIINQVCAGILVEHLGNSTSNDVEDVLRPYLEARSESSDVARDGASLLCALVRLKAVYSPPLSDLQLSITRKITAYFKQLKKDEAIHDDLRSALESIHKNGDESAKSEAGVALESLGGWTHHNL